MSEHQYETLLPMIADYQRFYEVDQIDAERNRRFFARFLHPSDDGLLLGAWEGNELVGYARLYWFFSSTRATETVLMNDLYVGESRRGAGVGRALIEAVEWATAPGNAAAQRLYESTGAERSTWITYELRA